MTPYYERDGITIYHGDCREIVPSLTGVTAVLTDPPFGIGKADWDDTFPDWLWGLIPESSRTVGVMPGIWNMTRCPSNIGSLVYKWTLCAHLVNGMTRGAIGFGNWIPCLLYCDDEVSLYAKSSDVARVVVGREPKQDHPSPKPIGAVRFFASFMRGDCVLDPFCGTGTTLTAATEFGRRAIGIEIEERYCEIAAKRLEQRVLKFGTEE